MAVSNSAKISFVESVRLLVQLHELISSGEGDSAEADAIRDDADGPWYQMSYEEQQIVRGLSADLYTIGQSREPEEGDHDAIIREIESLLITKDWNRYLDSLRLHETKLFPAEVALMRGIAWTHLGYSVAAIPFLEEALRLRNVKPPIGG